MIFFLEYVATFTYSCLINTGLYNEKEKQYIFMLEKLLEFSFYDKFSGQDFFSLIFRYFQALSSHKNRHTVKKKTKNKNIQYTAQPQSCYFSSFDVLRILVP